MVLAPEHTLVEPLTAPERRAAVEDYRRRAASKSDLERTHLAKEKTGVFTGSYAVNPVNGARIPIWIADYVLTGYGTGAIMAVPAHDERDFEFATLYSLPVVAVVEPAAPSPAGQAAKLPYLGEGNLVRSGGYSGLGWSEGKRRITDDLAAKGSARPSVNFKLRDWLFSRQRYWGEPIPIVWVGEEDYRRAATRLGDAIPKEPVSFSQDAKGCWLNPGSSPIVRSCADTVLAKNERLRLPTRTGRPIAEESSVSSLGRKLLTFTPKGSAITAATITAQTIPTICSLRFINYDPPGGATQAAYS